MASEHQWQFEYKITLGNMLTALSMLGAAIYGYTDLKTQINLLGNTVHQIPAIEERIGGIEQRGIQARSERTALQEQVDKLELRSDEQMRQLNLILQTVARIDERVANISRGR